jgi:hypothetical protein
MLFAMVLRRELGNTKILKCIFPQELLGRSNEKAVVMGLVNCIHWREANCTHSFSRKIGKKETIFNYFVYSEGNRIILKCVVNKFDVIK